MGGLRVLSGLMGGVASGINISTAAKEREAADKSRKELGTSSKKAGPGLPAGASQGPDENTPEPIMGRLAEGGRIKRTGVYRLHKGEFVVNARDAKRIKSRKSGRKSCR